MLIRMQLSLPRDARYVALLRDVADCILHDLEAPESAIDDVQLALAEACANAVRHAVGSAEYTVSLAVGKDGCEINVADFGPGFAPPEDWEQLDPAELDPQDESGRGLLLMRALVDELHFSRDDSVTEVRLVKRWDDLGLDYEREGFRKVGADDRPA